MAATFACTQLQKEKKQKVLDLIEGQGRVDWLSLEKSFGFRSVELDDGRPSVFPSGEKEGLTRERLFQPHQTYAVNVDGYAGDGLGGKELIDCLQSMKEGFMDALTHANKASPAPLPEFTTFSQSTIAKSNRVFEDLGFPIANGHDLEPLEDLLQGEDIPDFAFGKYANEDAGISDLIAYHQKYLGACGVRFGRGHYAMHDVHKMGLELPDYRGGADAVLVPHGIPKNIDATPEALVVFEHRQNASDKEIYKLTNSNDPEVTKGEDKVARSEMSVACTAVALAIQNAMTVDAVLFDGHTAVLFRLRQDELLIYEGVPPSKLYPALASYLATISPPPKRRPSTAELDSVDSALIRPPKRLHSALGMDDVEGPQAHIVPVGLFPELAKAGEPYA